MDIYNGTILSQYYFEGGAWAFEASELVELIDWFDGLREMASRDLQCIPRGEGGGLSKSQLDDNRELQELSSLGVCREWWRTPKEISEYLDRQEMYTDYIMFEQDVSREHLLRHYSVVVGEEILQPSENLYLPFNVECGNTYVRCEVPDVPCFLISVGDGLNGYCVGVTDYGTVWIPPKMKKHIALSQCKSWGPHAALSLDPRFTFSISMRVVGGSSNPWKANWVNR